MNILAGLLLVGLTAVGVSSALGAQSLSAREAFREACNLSRYDCTGIKAPMVRESVYVRRSGNYGVYFGGRTVWLANDLSPERRYVTMVHEMVHYLQARVDEDGPPMQFPIERCVYESEAFEASNQVSRRLNIPEMPQDKFDEHYNCGASE